MKLLKAYEELAVALQACEQGQPKPAQLGYRGHCKICFGTQFSQDFEGKSQKRSKRTCWICQGKQELVPEACADHTIERPCAMTAVK